MGAARSNRVGVGGSPLRGNSIDAGVTNFMAKNKKNLGVTINRMHPQYELWDA